MIGHTSGSHTATWAARSPARASAPVRHKLVERAAHLADLACRDWRVAGRPSALAPPVMRSTVLLAAILASPPPQSRRRLLPRASALVRRQQGARGAVARRAGASDLAGASAGNAGALLACDDFLLFSVGSALPAMRFAGRGTLVGAVGVFGRWWAVAVSARAPRSYPRSFTSVLASIIRFKHSPPARPGPAGRHVGAGA